MAKVVFDRDEYWLPSMNCRDDEPYEGEVIHNVPMFYVWLEKLTYRLWRMSVKAAYRRAGVPYPR